jgi:hypothetical protein
MCRSHVVSLRWVPVAALLGGLVGCAQEDVTGRLSCVVYDDEVACDQQGCVAPDGGVADETPVEATLVLVSNEASRFQPDGVYVYAELPAPAAALGVLELDVPRNGAGEPFVAYGEWRGTEPVFTATRTAGTIVVAPAGDRRGRFLLRLDDSGPDGELGTADDLVRVLAAGVYGPSGAAAPAEAPLASPAPPGEDDGAVLIDVIDLVDDLGDVVDPPVDDPGGDPGDEGGCGGEDVGDDGSGCDSGSTGDSGGCEGDTGGGGCEGDTGGGGCDGGGGGGGCDGADLGGGGCDGADFGGGCEGDYARGGARSGGATTTPRAGGRPHARGPQRLAPLVLVGGVAVWCRRSGRRR